MRIARALAVVLFAAAALVACEWPRDPDGTLDRVRSGVLNVGVVDSPPWASAAAGSPSGAEVVLVERLADQLGARVAWTKGSQPEVVTALEHGAVDLGIGGFAADDPWTDKVTFTREYLTTRAVIAVPPGSSPYDSVEDVEVSVERDAELIGLIRAEKGRPHVVADLEGVEGPVAVEEWDLGTLGLEATDVELEKTDHVFAVRHGENAWLTTVESFLLDQDRAELLDLLAEADR